MSSPFLKNEDLTPKFYQLPVEPAQIDNPGILEGFSLKSKLDIPVYIIDHEKCSENRMMCKMRKGPTGEYSKVISKHK